MTQQDIVLLHSSSDDDRIIRACESLAVNQRLVKPIKMAELYRALSRLTCHDDKALSKDPNQSIHLNSNPIRVLLVEDNKVNQLLAKTIVSRIVPNAQIIEAINGQEAVQKYTQQRPDLVLMDIQMPIMNGYEATQRIRELEQNYYTPIIALTAGTVKGEQEKCLAVGMDDFITKPIIEESIVALFQKWVGPQSAATSETTLTEVSDSHFDIEVLKTMACQDMAFVRELMEAAETELQSSLSVVLRQAENRDLTGLKATGHKLRGTTLSAGMEELAQLAYTLEHLERFETDSVHVLINQIQSEIILVLSLLAQALKVDYHLN